MRWGRILRIAGLIAGFVVLLFFGARSCVYHFLTGVPSSWHQELRIEIDTPDGPVTASSVVSIDYRTALEWTRGMDSPDYDITGEAIVVELGERYLFVLMDGTGGHLHRAIMHATGERMGMPDAVRLIKRQYEPLELPPGPRLVTFEDINDPTTVRQVDYTDLAASFGEGYAFKRLTVQATDKPVTLGRVEEVLGWLEAVGRERATLKGRPEKGLVSEQPDPSNYLITPSDFSTELYK